MLSFFSKKKQSLESPDIIQGPESQPTDNNGGDDFIFVERKPDDPSQQVPVYPPMPPAFGIGGLPYPSSYPPHPGSRTDSTTTPVPYVQGVPFILSPQLCSKNSFEMTQLQVDGILAFLTRQMSMEEEYSFALERSVQTECGY